MNVSVIIPYYNRKNLLLNTISCFEKQDYCKNNFELVVIDDGSSDLSECELKKFKVNIVCKKFTRSENSCASFARNKGIEFGSGDLFIFLDCDQLTLPNFISEHVDFYKKHDYPIFQIGTRKNLLPYQDINNLAKVRYYPDFRHRVLSKDYKENLKGIWHLVWSHNISIERKYLDKYGGFDEKFKCWGLEDVELGYRMHKNGIKILYNKNIETYHQFHEELFDANRFNGWKRNLLYFIDKHFDAAVAAQIHFIDINQPAALRRLKNQGYSYEDIWFKCYDAFEKALSLLVEEKSG